MKITNEEIKNLIRERSVWELIEKMQPAIKFTLTSPYKKCGLYEAVFTDFYTLESWKAFHSNPIEAICLAANKVLNGEML